MILKQLRMARLISQEQLAQMSGLSVRTIQRIESGHQPSPETLKCLAAALEVDVLTLTQEHFIMDKQSGNWQQLPLGLKWLFTLNFFSLRPNRSAACRGEFISHSFGFIFCFVGLWSEAALAGGLMLLANAWLFHLHLWLGDKYSVWYDSEGPSQLSGG